MTRIASVLLVLMLAAGLFKLRLMDGHLYDIRRDMGWHITTTLEPCP